MRLAVLLLSGAALSAEAQLPTLLPGARVRVDGDSRQQIEGTLMAQTADSITVAASGAVHTRLASAAVGRIRASEGKSRATGAAKGAKIGAVISGTMGLLLGAAFYGSSDVQSADLAGIAVTYAASGALWGAGIGAVVGAEKWTTVYERPLRVSIQPLPQGRTGLVVGVGAR